MLTLPKVLHIEPTSACNAACPQCAREFDTNFNKSATSHLTISQLRSLVDETTISQLEKMYMCGNYGDPAAGKYTLDIYRYIRSINPSITLGMNTNGGLRSTEWWKELANIIKHETDYVVFSIDGLADTNHLYRANVIWKKVIKNLTSFISNGGQAHWEMLIFEHNQHQVEEVKALAKSLGVKWFRTKISQRFDQIPISFLKPPSASSKTSILDSNTINCYALKTASVYISAEGIMHPCCWHGTIGGKDINDFTTIQASWNTENPNTVCKNTCSSIGTKTIFDSQWVFEEQLN